MPSKVRILDPPQQKRPAASTDRTVGRSSLGPVLSDRVRLFTAIRALYAPQRLTDGRLVGVVVVSTTVIEPDCRQVEQPGQFAKGGGNGRRM